MTYETQLHWIHSIQKTLRSSFIDGFFKGWDFLDSLYFSTIVIALVWYLWDRRKGTRLFYVLTISLVVNKILKDLFHHPRPCQLDPSVGVLCFMSPGFPSGAAQTATILAGFVFLETKRVLYRWLAVIFAVFLCFSRIYLGVHYPTDILGGLVVGSLLLLMYAKVFPLWQKKWKAASLGFPFCLLLLGIVFSVEYSWVLYLFLATLGVSVGLITYEKKMGTKGPNLTIRIWQSLSVIGGLFILFLLELYVSSLDFLWSFGEGFWLSFLGGWVVLKWKRHVV